MSQPGSPSSKLQGVVPTEGPALLEAIKTQVEWYFSRQNLERDNHLRTRLMDAKYSVDLKEILNFAKVKKLTQDENLFRQAVASSSVICIEDGRIKPNSIQYLEGLNMAPIMPPLAASTASGGGGGAVEMSKKRDIILREIPSDAPIDEVKEIFNYEGCRHISQIRSEFGNQWYVTFDSEADAKETFLVIKERTFRGNYIKARIKPDAPAPPPSSYNYNANIGMPKQQPFLVPVPMGGPMAYPMPFPNAPPMGGPMFFNMGGNMNMVSPMQMPISGFVDGSSGGGFPVPGFQPMPNAMNLNMFNNNNNNNNSSNNISNNGGMHQSNNVNASMNINSNNNNNSNSNNSNNINNNSNISNSSSNNNISINANVNVNNNSNNAQRINAPFAGANPQQQQQQPAQKTPPPSNQANTNKQAGNKDNNAGSAHPNQQSKAKMPNQQGGQQNQNQQGGHRGQVQHANRVGGGANPSGNNHNSSNSNSNNVKIVISDSAFPPLPSADESLPSPGFKGPTANLKWKQDDIISVTKTVEVVSVPSEPSADQHPTDKQIAAPNVDLLKKQQSHDEAKAQVQLSKPSIVNPQAVAIAGIDSNSSSSSGESNANNSTSKSNLPPKEELNLKTAFTSWAGIAKATSNDTAVPKAPAPAPAKASSASASASKGPTSDNSGSSKEGSKGNSSSSNSSSSNSTRGGRDGGRRDGSGKEGGDRNRGSSGSSRNRGGERAEEKKEVPKETTAAPAKLNESGSSSGSASNSWAAVAALKK